MTHTLKRKANQIRKDIMKMIYRAKTGHTGSDLSCADILVTLYYHVLKIDPQNPDDPERDRYVQSKGHAAEVLWAVLADKGFFEKEELLTFSQYQSRLIGHPNNQVPGVEMNTGSLGHGLAVSTGMALAAKMDKKPYKVYTLMGDGELAEGSVWEGAMAAAHYQLDNLTAIIDRNGLQITGKSEDVMGIDPLADKWRSFGWQVLEVDGNDVDQLISAFGFPNEVGRPKMIIAHTVKGKGVSLAENTPEWHHYVPSEEEYTAALNDLDNFMGGTSHDK
ncbi:transketolase [Vagococcus elongatus]